MNTKSYILRINTLLYCSITELIPGGIIIIIALTFFASGIGKLLYPACALNALVITFGDSYDVYLTFVNC